MNQVKKLINHHLLGGDVVDRNPQKVPQRKPEKTMSGEQLLNKAIFGTPEKPIDDKGWGKK